MDGGETDHHRGDPEREYRRLRALAYLDSLGLLVGPRQEDFPTFSDWLRAWHSYTHARTMAGYRWRQIEREAEAEQGSNVSDPHIPTATPRRQTRTSAGPRGTRSDTHNAVGLTPDAIREIRRRRAEGEDRKALATEFGISPAMVGMIAHRRRHAHVPD